MSVPHTYQGRATWPQMLSYATASHLSCRLFWEQIQTPPHPSGSPRHDSQGTARLGLAAVGSTLQRLLQAGLAPLTQQTLSDKNKCLVYCQAMGVVPLPTSEAAELRCINGQPEFETPNNQGLPVSSTAPANRVRRWRPPGGAHAPLGASLAGGQEGAGRRAHQDLPTDNTSGVGEAVASLELDPTNRNHIMLWAACYVAFFSFLRSGELTVAESGGYDPGQHLPVGDMSVDDAGQLTRVTLRIKQSKTDPFRRGVSEYLHQTNVPLCPVSVLLAYLVIRGRQDGPLFQMAALQAAGMNPSNYTGHSFRIRAATTAAACRVPVDTIKMLGRWRSDAYQLYVRIPRPELALISRALASASTLLSHPVAYGWLGVF